MYSVGVLYEGKKVDITNFAGKVELSTSLDSLGATFTFDLARNYNNENFATVERIQTGDIIFFYHDDMELFQGIVTELTTEKNSKSVSCLDFAFYLKPLA
jgi:hypothetical protein